MCASCNICIIQLFPGAGPSLFPASTATQSKPSGGLFGQTPAAPSTQQSGFSFSSQSAAPQKTSGFSGGFGGATSGMTH